MDPNKDRQRKVIAIAALAMLIFGSLLFLLALPGKEEPILEQTTGQTASGSGSSSSPQAKSEVKYQGFGSLSQHGFTEVQMAGIRYALFEYAPKAKDFNITTSTIKDDPYNPDTANGKTNVRFTIYIDSNVYEAVVAKYLDFNTVQLSLSTGGKQVYASQPIDVSKLKPDPGAVGD